MNANEAVRVLKARLIAPPPSVEALRPQVEAITRRVVMQAAQKGRTPRAQIIAMGDRLTVQVTGPGSSSVQRLIDSEIRRLYQQMAGTVREQAIERLRSQR